MGTTDNIESQAFWIQFMESISYFKYLHADQLITEICAVQRIVNFLAHEQSSYLHKYESK